MSFVVNLSFSVLVSQLLITFSRFASGRFGTVVYRNVSIKITVSTHLQRKIIVFPEGTTFANALVSARLEQNRVLAVRRLI